MAKFTKVGSGVIHTSKAGKKSIHLKLDKIAQDRMLNHDFENGIYVFKQKNTQDGNPTYAVMAPMPDDYEM